MDKTGGEQGSMVVDLFRHNTWANLRLLDACEGLSEEQLDATVSGTYGSIRDTLLHIIRGEMRYVERVTGRWPDEPLKPDEFPGFDVLKRVAGWCGDELLAIALTARVTDLVQEVSETEKVSYKLTGLLTQVINHGNDHRSQVATMLAQQGINPPELDGWAYMEAMGEFEVVEA